MASGGSKVARGSFLGTGSSIDCRVVGFRPRSVKLFNVSGSVLGTWIEGMADAAVLKQSNDGGSVSPCFLGQPVLADVDRIVDDQAFADGSLTIAAQLDCPRNITIALTDADNSCTGTILVTGKDNQGRAVTETISPDGLGGGKTLTGTKIFASVTSVVVSLAAGAGGGDLVNVGVGNKIGLPLDIAASSKVLDVYLGGTRIAAPTIVTGTSISTVDVSAGTYDGAKAMIVWLSVPNQLASLASSGGITPLSDGFRLGTDADLNVSAELVYFECIE
jgi:hypothetical protein